MLVTVPRSPDLRGLCLDLECSLWALIHRGPFTWSWPINVLTKIGSNICPPALLVYWEAERVITNTLRRRRNSREAGYHARWVDFTCRPFFRIVWLRSIVRGRLPLTSSGTVFMYIYILSSLSVSSSLTQRFHFFLSPSSWSFYLPRIYGKWKVRSSSPDDSRCEPYRGHRRDWTSWWRWNSGDCEAGVLQGLQVTFQRRRLVVSSSSISSWGACGGWDGFCSDGAQFLPLILGFVGPS